MTGALDVNEFVAGYLVEVEEHLSASTANLLAVEAALRAGESSPRPIRELFRALHTIKGLSAMVGVEPIVDLAHGMETVLRAADRAAGSLSGSSIEVLLRGLRSIEERARALAEGKPVLPAAPELLAALTALDLAAAPSPPVPTIGADPEILAKLGPGERVQLAQGVAGGRRALRVDFTPSPARTAEGVNITTVRERVGKLAEIVKVVPLSVPASDGAPGGIVFALLVLTSAPDEEVARAAAADGVRALTVEPAVPPAVAALAEREPDEPVDREPQLRGVVRVEVARLDDALDKLSALVVTRFRLARAAAELRARGVDTRDLSEILREHDRTLRDLRGAIMRARMISVKELLERVPLVVRGLGRATGKQVRLEIDAGKAELDKAVAERVFPAIVHLLRNAVDHAIEPPAERRRLGKPEEGVVRVSCFERSSNQLELSVADDGRGIDRALVARRAGRPAPESDAALLDLITLPGLSTLDQATKTSGRGLGMDIVRRIAVEQLSGELAVSTSPGAGTTFTLRIPLTLTIVDAFSFLCGDQLFVTPVAGVEEVVEIDAARIIRGPAPGEARGGSMLPAAGEARGGSMLPAAGEARGGTMLPAAGEARGGTMLPAAGEARGGTMLIERRGEVVPLVDLGALFETGASPARRALVVRRHGAPFAFGVTRVIGQQEVVVRPLEDPLVRVPGVSGSTDLGDGRPTLVLDLVTLSGRLSAGRGGRGALVWVAS
ncbi:chemotaxis protein CheA [Sorangium atrum]|uniref:histidine kinase n=1 Tax=Sorangium atrum TaxID=2995308 RepID=A0ABT5CG15_9BACT|nr:chemotaxis protein CheW [Sorangium aterium]MDC0685374.1 chemotaxis protein CheW [Sorangium aterium]